MLSGLTLVIALLAITIPYMRGADWFGFVALPLPVVVGLMVITLAYLAASETVKHWFFAHERHHGGAKHRL